MTQQPPVPVPLPSPSFRFVFVDLTTTATPDALRPARAFQPIIDAISQQIDGPFGKAHGHADVAFRIASSPTDRQAGEIACNYRDTIPEATDALAYHSVTGGIPDIEIGVDLFNALTSGVESVSGGVDHEVLELLKDAGANGWKDKEDGSGKTGAEEVADPVQNTGYAASNGVWLSNFILPSYWVPGSAGPWDYLGVMKTQADLSSGYEIQAAAPTDGAAVQGDVALPAGQTQPAPAPMLGENLHHGRKVFIAPGSAELSELQRKRKASPYSRTYRHGVRL